MNKNKKIIYFTAFLLFCSSMFFIKEKLNEKEEMYILTEQENNQTINSDMNVEVVKYGSVFIYKNGFRIYPFGEEGDDTLQIDRRKQQGYNRFLGTRELIGRIEINGEQSNLKETTSRDGGLIKNDSYTQLYEMFYDKALKRLEKYTVDIIKWGDDRTDKETGEYFNALNPEDVKGEIIDIITNLTRAKDVIDITYDKDF